MNLEALVEQLPTLRAEANRWREQEAESRRKAEGYEEIVRGVENLVGAPGAASTASSPKPEVVNNSEGSPTGIAAVRRVILEQPERIWRARDLHSVLEQRQWISPGAQVPLRGTEAAINRLMHAGELERTQPGYYRATEQIKRAED